MYINLDVKKLLTKSYATQYLHLRKKLTLTVAANTLIVS
jgi:hypothetical protein